MIKQYLQLLDSFKEENVAGFLSELRKKILTTLHRNTLSYRAQTYFSSAHIEGQPFTDFDEEPKQIIQIKRVINAIYHAQLAFEDLQSVSFRYQDLTYQDIKKLYKTVEHAYTASYLLTHLDIDLKELFGSDVDHQLIQMMTHVKSSLDKHGDCTQLIHSMLNNYSVGYHVGWCVGVAIDQMGADEDRYDYNFLAQFGAVLPTYIQQLTLKLRQFAPHLSTYQPTIDKKKLEDLQESAFKLLTSIDNLDSADIFISMKALNVIKIIRHIFTLSMSTLEQIGTMNESSQDVIRQNLSKLKYVHCLRLFALVDRIEDQSLLRPGTLSKRLMAHMKPWHDLLGTYAAKLVDFSVNGQELLTLEDNAFIDARLASTRQRMAEAEWNLVKQRFAQQAFRSFFSVLQSGQKAHASLLMLPKEIKDNIASVYRFLEPYLKAIDPQLANLIVIDLTEENTWSLSSTWRWMTGQSKGLPIKTVLDVKPLLKTELSKDKATQILHIKLNVDIQCFVKGLEKQACPFQGKPFIPSFNEAAILGLDPAASVQPLLFRNTPAGLSLSNPDALTFDQTQRLYTYHKEKSLDLRRTQKAWAHFRVFLITERGNWHHDKVKQINILRLYRHIQPYFLASFYESKQGRAQDRAILARLNDPLPQLASTQDVSSSHSLAKFFNVHRVEQLDALFQHLKLFQVIHVKKAELYLRVLKRKYVFETQAKPLQPNSHPNPRAHFVIQHTEFSKAIEGLRASLTKILALFSQTFQTQCKPGSHSALPFPEIEDRKTLLLEPKQVLGLKQLFNALYHLEATCHDLEKLDHRSSQSLYVYHLIQAKGHLDAMITLIKELAHDPHFSLLVTELKDKAWTIAQQLLEHKETYALSNDRIVLPNNTYADQDLESNSLWYTLHTFMLIPAHLKDLIQEGLFRRENKETIHARSKEIGLRIEQIIRDSSSYFKLFLDTPSMYRLYTELKQTLINFSTITRSAVLSHLDEIHTDLFTRMLLEADHWEDKLGLKPGLLADPLKELLDEFYKGLLEPLNLRSQDLIYLISNLAPISFRIDAAQKKLAQSKQQLIPPDLAHAEALTEELDTSKYQIGHASLSDKYILIKTLLDDVQQQGIRKNLFALTDIERIHRERLIKLFITAAPILNEVRKELKLEPEPIDKNTESIELLLHQALQLNVQERSIQPDEDPAIVVFQPNPSSRDDSCDYPPTMSIIKLAKVALLYYQGLQNSTQFDVDTTKERIDYLNTLKQKQNARSQQWISEYINKVFHWQIQALTARHIGFLHVRDEYNQALRHYLKSQSTTLLQDAEHVQDIDTYLAHSLRSHVNGFNRKNFINYQQLEAIRASFAEFEVYFSKAQKELDEGAAFFENNITLLKKIQTIDALKKLACNNQVPIDIRLESIKNKLSKRSVQMTLLAHQHYASFTFNWLQECVLSLLSILGLYVPKDKALLERLNQATENKGLMLRDIGLFSLKSSRHYDLPKPIFSVT